MAAHVLAAGERVAAAVGRCPRTVAAAVAVVVGGYGLYLGLNRTKARITTENYRQQIARAYDDWTDDGVLHKLWGEHVHHGHYGTDGRASKGFVAAKVDMIEEALAWCGAAPHLNGPHAMMLDVGCGIGGSSRHIAQQHPALSTTGVSLSPRQVATATKLTADARLAERVSFFTADAMKLPFEDATFDFIWSFESGEHMPQKMKFFAECLRVLKPGGRILIVTWCHRSQEAGANPLKPWEKSLLDRVYLEWQLPYFIAIDEYEAFAASRQMRDIQTADWTAAASPTWWHCIVEGFYAIPYLCTLGPATLWRTLRDVFAVIDMIRGYRSGVIRYGLLTAVKPE